MSFLCLKPSFSVISQRTSQSLQGPTWLLYSSFCFSDSTSYNSSLFLCFSHTVLLAVLTQTRQNSASGHWYLLFPLECSSPCSAVLFHQLLYILLNGTLSNHPFQPFFPSTFHCILLIYLPLLSAISPKYKLHEGKDLYSCWYSQHLDKSHIYSSSDIELFVPYVFLSS